MSAIATTRKQPRSQPPWKRKRKAFPRRREARVSFAKGLSPPFAAFLRLSLARKKHAVRPLTVRCPCQVGSLLKREPRLAAAGVPNLAIGETVTLLTLSLHPY